MQTEPAPSIPVAGASSVASLDLFTPPPLPRAQTIQARVKLNNVTLTPTEVAIIPDSPVMPLINVTVPAGSSEAYFQFVLASSFPASYVRILIHAGGGMSTPIDIALA